MTRTAWYRFVLVGLLGLTFFSGGEAVSAQELTYSVTDIGSLAGTGDGQFDVLDVVVPVDMSDSGTIIANSTFGMGFTWAVPFTSTDGKIRRLGKEKQYSHVFDINDSDEIVGVTTSLGESSFEIVEAVVWRERKAIELESLGGNLSMASAINDQGVIVGSSTLSQESPSPNHAVRWEADVVADLGTLGGENSFAAAISEAGAVVGRSDVSGQSDSYPFLWEDGEMTQLATPDDLPGEAVAINDDGTIIGFVVTDSSLNAAVQWSEGEPDYLPAFADGQYTNALGLNNAGVIVGEAGRESEPFQVAVIWNGDAVTDLNELIPSDFEFALYSAVSINDMGQILATGNADGGPDHGFLLTPENDAATSGLANAPVASRRDAA